MIEQRERLPGQLLLLLFRTLHRFAQLSLDLLFEGLERGVGEQALALQILLKT
jgi:hypothetical protein